MIDLPPLPLYDISKEEEKLTWQWLSGDCEINTNEVLNLERTSAVFLAELLQPLEAPAIPAPSYVDLPIFPNNQSHSLTGFKGTLQLETSCDDIIEDTDEEMCEERLEITKEDLSYLQSLLQPTTIAPKPVYRRMSVPDLLSSMPSPKSPSLLASPMSISSIEQDEDYKLEEDLQPIEGPNVEKLVGPTPLKRRGLKIETLLTPISCKRPKVTHDLLKMSILPVDDEIHGEKEPHIFKEEDLIVEDTTLRISCPKLPTAIPNLQTTDITESPWGGLRSIEIDLEWQPFRHMPRIDTNETPSNETSVHELIVTPSTTGPPPPIRAYAEEYIEVFNDESPSIVNITPPKSVDAKQPMEMSIRERLHGFMSLHNRSPLMGPPPITPETSKTLTLSSTPISMERSLLKQHSSDPINGSIPPPKHTGCSYPLIVTTTLLRDTKFMRTLSALHETIIEREDNNDADLLISPVCGIILLHPAMLTQKDFQGKFVAIERVDTVCARVDQLHVIIRGFPTVRASPVLTMLAARGIHYWWCGLDAADAVFWVLDILRRCGRETILETSETVHERFLRVVGFNAFAAQEALRRGPLKDLVLGNISSDGLGQSACALLSRWKREW